MDIFSFVWFELTKVLTQKSTLQAKMCIKSKFIFVSLMQIGKKPSKVLKVL